MDTILLFTTSSGNARTEMLAGVREFASDANWNVRITLAKSLLADTVLPISSIAEQCGYRFQTQFRKIFLKATGHNPLHWRQCAKRGEPHP